MPEQTLCLACARYPRALRPHPGRDNRYQHQPWYVRLWRRRHELTVPLVAWGQWRRLGSDGTRNSFGFAWSIARGLAHARMKWWYYAEECALALGEEESDIG